MWCPSGFNFRAVVVYVNDLHRALTDSHFIIFANNTNISITHSDYATLNDRLDKDLYNISEWLKSNKLSLNIRETHYMLFHRSKIKNMCAQEIHIDDININTNIVGVILS